MAESSHADAGMRFASDLRRIREHRGITVDELHDETKIPVGLIDSFEHTGLFDHPMFNRVYLRSFVRTYAQVVGISSDLALAQLDEALEGRYVDQLAREYLPQEQRIPPAQELASPEVQQQESFVGSEPETAADARAEAPEASEARTEPPPPVILPVPPPESLPQQQGEALQPEDVELVEPDLDEPATIPSEAVAPPPVPAQREPVARPPRNRSIEPATLEEEPNRAWLYAAAGIVAVVVVLVILFWAIGPSQRAATVPEQPISATPASPSAADTLGETVAAPVTLGDTMHVSIVAANGPVQNIKVTVDDDLRRPYWIEDGQSMTFTPTQRIIIERQIPKIQLQVEGAQYPTDHLDDQGRIVITRDSALEYLGNPG
ncbi:MAG TPA: helix-turn-helix domain-containing protein [Rhodothermales bacterium]|nr:helix-turn-helix domain-containing protein [Rhodothermales bacterium]